jgi:hypothetical protein
MLLRGRSNAKEIIFHITSTSALVPMLSNFPGSPSKVLRNATNPLSEEKMHKFVVSACLGVEQGVQVEVSRLRIQIDVSELGFSYFL